MCARINLSVRGALLLLVLVAALPAGSSAGAGGGRQAPDAQAADAECPDCALKVTTSPLTRIFCPTNAEMANLRWRLRVHFENTGKQPLILYRGSGGAPTISISKSLEDAQKGIEEKRIASSLHLIGEFDKGVDLEQYFVTLKPGESFDSETHVNVPVMKDNRPSTRRALRPGDHYLKITVITSPDTETESLSETLRAKWRQKGYLWTRNVNSEPMPFKLEENPVLSDCSNLDPLTGLPSTQ